jgi:hypothetical protein
MLGFASVRTLGRWLRPLGTLEGPTLGRWSAVGPVPFRALQDMDAGVVQGQVRRQALNGAEQLHSRRVAEVLHELSGAAHKHTDVSDVKELCGTITALVGSS